MAEKWATVVVFLTIAHSAIGQDTLVPRVRTESAAIAAVIKEGTRLSPTFHDLIDTINRSDGLVYIEEGECPHHFPACMAHSVKLAGPNRLLRVRVDRRRSGLDATPPDADLIATVGHELRHVVEVLSDPTLRTYFAIEAFYLREGTFSFGTGIETVAAERAGLAISTEVKRTRKARSSRRRQDQSAPSRPSD
jgi:hypothetical protein